MCSYPSGSASPPNVLSAFAAIKALDRISLLNGKQAKNEKQAPFHPLIWFQLYSKQGVK